MATSHGKAGLVKVGTDTIAETTGWSLTETAETVDDTAHGDTARTHLVGHTSWTASITCHLDPSDTSGQGALTVGASVTITLLAAAFAFMLGSGRADADPRSQLPDRLRTISAD